MSLSCYLCDPFTIYIYIYIYKYIYLFNFGICPKELESRAWGSLNNEDVYILTLCTQLTQRTEPQAGDRSGGGKAVA